MCINRVKIGNDYFPCGTCPACKQAAADSRVQMISSHNRDGYVPYFVTLTYENKFVPYVYKKDLYALYSYIHRVLCIRKKRSETTIHCIDANGKYHATSRVELPCIDDVPDKFVLPIFRKCDYRNYKLTRGRKLLHPISYKKIYKEQILKHSSKYFYELNEIKKIKGARFKTKGMESYGYLSNIVPVVFSSDAQNFLKRLRKNISKAFNRSVEIDYFRAPEYGETYARPHFHFILWLPSYITETQARRFVFSSWKLCRENLSKKQCEVARNAASYVSTYVNCNPNVSTALLKTFPLRTSHSLSFGFYTSSFSFDSFYCKAKSGIFGYDCQRIKPNGSVQQFFILFSTKFIRRFLPIFTHINRVPTSSLLLAFANPKEFFELSTQRNLDLDFGSKQYFTKYSFKSGFFVSYTPIYVKYIIKKILYLQEFYCKKIGYTKFDFAIDMCEFINKLFSFRLQKSHEFYNFAGVSDIFYYSNLDCVDKDNYSHLFEEEYCDPLNLKINPIDKILTDKLIDKFNKRVKQSKIFNFNK